MLSAPAAVLSKGEMQPDQPPVLLNVRESRVFPGCDSFNSLERLSEPAFWAIATVLRFLSKRLQAAKYMSPPRQV